MKPFFPDWVQIPAGSRFLVTGNAGFIGSALSEALITGGFQVRGLDNLSTGKQTNVDEISTLPGADQRFEFILGDIRDAATCQQAMDGIDYVLHHAAMGSVPQSVDDPVGADAINIGGTLNVLVAARDAGVKRVVYATSSACYGDDETMPKVEHIIGAPLSPYALTKYVNELYAQVFGTCYGLSCIGLRYFNVFGRRQDPTSTYAAVIPMFVSAMLRGEPPTMNGDGEQTRDFVYIDNVVQANLLAAVAPQAASGRVFNVAAGERTSLNQLYTTLQKLLLAHLPGVADLQPVYGPPRTGDVRHSLANIDQIVSALDYRVVDDAASGLAKAIDWYRKNL